MENIQNLLGVLKNTKVANWNYWNINPLLENTGFYNTGSRGSFVYFENGYSEDSYVLIIVGNNTDKQEIQNDQEILQDIVECDENWNWVLTNKNRYKRAKENEYNELLNKLKTIETFESCEIFYKENSKKFQKVSKVLDLFEIALENGKKIIMAFTESGKNHLKYIIQNYYLENKSENDFWVIY